MTGSNSSSPTGYVRIPASVLPTIELRHLVSGKDSTIAGITGKTTITGYTEWIGTWESSTLTLGWDWGVVGGVVVMLNLNELRTNIQLVADNGTTEPPGRARVLLARWIESIRWREIAINDVLRD